MKLLESVARFAYRQRVPVLILLALAIAGGSIYGAGAHRVLEAGGFEDPNSESAQAARILDREPALGQPDVVVAYLHPDPRQIESVIEALRARPEVKGVRSLPAKDGSAAVVSIDVEGDYRHLEPILRVPGTTSWIGGPRPAVKQAQAAAAHDLVRGEMIALPLVAILLVIFFRGAVLALLPLVIGGFAITSALAALRLLASFTTVSVFAMNIATFIGFGVAVDYSLFMTSRFRDELHGEGADVETAVLRTVTTAGKTVANSGLAVAISLLGLLVIPIPLLRSVAISGALVVILAVLATLLFLPALLSALGRHIGRLSFGPAHSTDDGIWWARLAHAVMRVPWIFAAATTLFLLVLGAPFLRMKESVGGARVLPEQAEARKVAELLESDRFPQNIVTPIEIVVLDPKGAPPEFLADIQKLPHVQRAFPIRGRTLPITVVTVLSDLPPDSQAAAHLVHSIRALRPPELTALVGGRAASQVDLEHSLDSHLPLALGLICLGTFVVLFLAFGSVVMPVKAILMNVLSLTASFGALVFIFQDGRFEELLGYRSTGSIELTIPVMMFAVIFGLAMDYELFLLSRIREAYDRTNDGRTSVALGLQQTGRIITRAALLVIAVMIGFISADMLLIKELGVGMAIAIAVDATIVRALLVPATMQLLGRYNWWSPRWLLKVLDRSPAQS